MQKKLASKGLGITAIFLVLYILTLSWSSVLRPSAWLPIYNVFLFLGISSFFFGFLIRQNKSLPKFIIFNEDRLIILFIILLSFSALINPNSKSINYVLAYFQVFVICFLLTRSIIIKKLSLRTILNTNTAAVCIASTFIVIEFTLRIFFLFDIHDYIPSYKEKSMAVVTEGIYRATGFGTEPTQTGFYLCALGPIAIWNLYKNININNKLKHLLVFFIILSLIFLFSVSSYLVIFLTTLMFILLRWKWRLKIFLRFLFSLLLIVFLISLYEPLYLIVLDILETIWGKMTFSGDGTSTNARTNLLLKGLERIYEYPIFGIGIGFSSSIDEASSINWYVFLMSEAGIPISMVLFSYMIIQLIRIYKSNIDARNPLLFGAFAGSAYLGTLSTFFYPNLWFVYIIYAKIILSENKEIL